MEKLSTKQAAKLCPVCAGPSKVFDTRTQNDGSILRKRKCKDCGKCFCTIESLLWELPAKKLNSH